MKYNLILKQLMQNPWKIFNEIYRLLILPIVYVYSKITIGSFKDSWKFYGIPIFQINTKSITRFGERMELRSSRFSNPLTPHSPVTISTRDESSHLEIGDDFGMTGGSIVCQTSIIIGNRVKVGANVLILDTDFHPIDYKERISHINNGKSKQIIIEDDVFIGTGSIILKGVKIGKGSVIGAGSVVTKDIGKHSVCAGNPARIISKV